MQGDAGKTQRREWMMQEKMKPGDGCKEMMQSDAGKTQGREWMMQ
jgi:hypothetical protein